MTIPDAEPVPAPPAARRRSNTSTWKSVERAIAAILGGERVPVTGRTIGSAPDIKHPRYALEVKHGKQVPKLLVKALKQAVASVRGDQVPMVILHPEGARYEDSLVVVYLKDLPRLTRQDDAV